MRANRDRRFHTNTRESLEVFEQALALAVDAVMAAVRAHEAWVDRIRAGLMALLEFFDQEPALARHLVVRSARAGDAVLERRREVLEQLALLLDDERAPARSYPPPLTAHAVVGGVLGVLHARLSQPDPGSLVELAGPLTSFTVLPFLGARAARSELRRAAAVPSSAVRTSVDLVPDLGTRPYRHRQIEVVRVLAAEPGLSNTQVALRAGVKDPAHISRLLARMQRLGLVANTQEPGRLSTAKAWRLTAAGKRLHEAIGRGAGALRAGAILGLPKELEGRLDYWAVCVLRVIGAQPWLTSSEVAARAGVEDQAHISRLLVQLAGLGLLDSARDAHARGKPKVWQITDAGRELDEAIGRATPAPPRSLALDLMLQSGGRLSENAISVLKSSAAEPGLSNGEIALRVGIGNANTMSKLLARLARRGLVENARNGGRRNVWLLTASGTELEQAIRQEAPAPVSRSVALDLLGDRGGRLSNRAVSVLKIVGTDPGLSNADIARRAGIASKGHASELLARLSRHGLIENQAVGSTRFKANSWRLTGSGRQLETAIRAG